MPLQCQLDNYKMWVNKFNNTVLLVEGEEIYYSLLRDAFPHYRFSPAWPDQYSNFDWGTYINGIVEDDREEIAALLQVYQTSICIEDALAQTFALDYHTRPFHGRTEVGELVYNAKYQGDRKAAANLVDEFSEFISGNPSYACTDFLVAAPSSSTKKWSLANYLVENLCARLDIENGSEYICKIRQTQPMKDLETEEEKFK